MIRYCFTDIVCSNCPPKGVVDPLTVGAIAAPVIGGIANLFGTSHSNKYNLQAVRETNEMNYKIHKEDNAFNAQQALLAQKYNTNERIASQGYNSAPAQISRLKAAGISPVMSGPVAGGSSSPASVSPASASSPISMQAGHVEPLNYGQALPDLLHIAQAKNDMRARMIEAGAAATNAATNADTLPKNAESQRTSAEAAKTSAEAAKTNAEVNKNKTEHDISLIDEQVKSQQLYNEWYPKLMESNIKVNDAQAKNLVNSIALGFARLNFDKMVQDWNQRFQVAKTKFDAKIHSADQKIQLDMFDKELRHKYDKLRSDVNKMNIDSSLRQWALMQIDQKLEYELNDLPMWVKSGSQVFKNIMSVGAILK